MDNPSGHRPLDLGYSSQKHPGAQAALVHCSPTAFRGSAQGTGHRSPCPSALCTFTHSCPLAPDNSSLPHRVSPLPLLLATDTVCPAHPLSPGADTFETKARRTPGLLLLPSPPWPSPETLKAAHWLLEVGEGRPREEENISKRYAWLGLKYIKNNTNGWMDRGRDG